MANGKTAGLLAVLLGAVAALGIGLAAAQNSGVEVRIEARRLDDGRVEFALSERGTDGEWGDRILPSSRYFPAGSRGRWLRSSPVSVGASAPAPTVRIEARRLGDGRIEFALSERGTDGEWGDRVLPSSRYFPAGSRGRWLRSSPVFVGASAPGEGAPTATSPSAAAPAPAPRASCPGGAVAEPDRNPGLAADRETLLAVRDVLAGDGRVPNWSVATPMDQWEGVTIGGSPPRVTGLGLDFNGLSGSIPPELGRLANLQALHLDYNELTGSIPPELGCLANLQALHLGYNELTGSIPPELGRLANLRQLWLGGNELSGSIPPELGRLANLRQLWLDGNELSGSIPPELGRLANLWLLQLDLNELSGSIPPELGGLANLEYLGLSGNGLTGSIPPELDGLANLRSLRLRDNDLSGGIPPELGGLANLETLWLSGNELTGCLPRALDKGDVLTDDLPPC